jgi:pimeloyl-ACP methyl ester carboxylesterase
MTAPLALPVLTWGAPDAPRRALLIHGLGSSAALMWRLGTALADVGWAASAVDLRGHGSAPRALDYTIDAFAADVSATTPVPGGAWDLVIGHSLGGAAAVVASAAHPDWARRLVLIDPGLVVLGADAEAVRVSQEQAFADNRAELVRAEHPDWHPQDIELKVDAVARASRWAVDQVAVQNPDWDVRDACARVAVPTHVIGADPDVYSLFTGEIAASVLAANPLFTMSIVAGAGHSPHRDKPDETVRQLLGVLEG